MKKRVLYFVTAAFALSIFSLAFFTPCFSDADCFGVRRGFPMAIVVDSQLGLEHIIPSAFNLIFYFLVLSGGYFVHSKMSKKTRGKALDLLFIVFLAAGLTIFSRNILTEQKSLCGGEQIGSCEYIWSSGWPFRYVGGFTAEQNPILLNFIFYLIVACFFTFGGKKLFKEVQKKK